MGKEVGLALDDAVDPPLGIPTATFEMLVLAHRPPREDRVEMAHHEVENRPVVEPVVVDPAPKGGIHQLREVAESEIAPQVKAPAPHFLADRRGRLRADCWVEADEHLPAVAFGQSRLEWSSGPGESHPKPLSEPYVSLSTHTAPII
jgi:hypothetical protein